MPSSVACIVVLVFVQCHQAAERCRGQASSRSEADGVPGAGVGIVCDQRLDLRARIGDQRLVMLGDKR